MKAKRHEHLQRKPKKGSAPTVGRPTARHAPESDRQRNAESRRLKPINLSEMSEAIASRFVFFRGEMYPTYWIFTYKGTDEPAEGEIVGHTPSLGSAPPQTLTWESGGVVARSKNR